MPTKLSAKQWAFCFFHANKDAEDEATERFAWARQNWYMHALAMHNVKEFSKKLMQEPSNKGKTTEDEQRDADEQFVLFDAWLAQIPEAPPDWVVDAYLNNTMAPVPQIDDPAQQDDEVNADER